MSKSMEQPSLMIKSTHQSDVIVSQAGKYGESQVGWEGGVVMGRVCRASWKSNPLFWGPKWL